MDASRFTVASGIVALLGCLVAFVAPLARTHGSLRSPFVCSEGLSPESGGA